MLAGIFSGSTFRYVFMPQFLPRMNNLIFGGFQYFPYLLAVVFRNARLLPANHPYLFYGNAGRFGIRHVMAQAGSNLRFSFANIDQIVLFLIVIAAIVLITVQVLSIGAFFFLSSAMALPTNWNDFFVIPVVSRSQDIASILLDMVFGVPYLGIVGAGGSFSFFESCIGMPGAICTTNSPLVLPELVADIDLSLTPAAGLPADEFSPLSTNANARFPFPYHRGLHSLFGVYSQGLLVVAVIMVSYFIATILAETAQTGTPFGRRYNKLWVPIRIVMAFGLLMPLGGNPISAALGVGTGLNSAQYIVLYAAKYGSAFATNGWRLFNNTIGQAYTGDIRNLVSNPNPPDLTGFLNFIYVVNVCEELYEFYDLTTADTIRMWVHGDETSGTSVLEVNTGTTLNDAIALLGGRGRTLVISFGEQDATKYETERGNVMPLCGQIRWSLADPRPTGVAPPGAAEPAVSAIQVVYWNSLRDLWHNNSVLTNIPPNPETTGSNRRDIALLWKEVAASRPGGCTTTPDGSCAPHGYLPDQTFKRGVEEAFKTQLRALFLTLSTLAIPSTSWLGAWNGAVSPLYHKGWGGAGIWYNSVAAMNGNITHAALNPPTPSQYPSIMERVRELKMKHETTVTSSQMFNPNVPGLSDISGYLSDAARNDVARTLYAAYVAWDPADGSTTQNRPTKNPIIDMISAIFGTNGLYAMRNNPNVHPLAQLVGIGAALVNAAARNLGIAGVATVIGIGLGDVVDGAGSLGSTLGSISVSIASIAMTIGFVLYYVLPFLPFVYFFFAMGGWVKGIFEALVGAPLWALAHIRIDGQGLPGNAALNGYFLIFEIFIRPMLILFGFLASISIFAALVTALHSVFPLMTSNLSGFEGDAISDPGVASIVTYMRGRIDQFFMTIMYAVMVYMIGMSSFKLIDLIPNNILRWMGQSVATFNDMREDAVQGLVSRASMGAQQVVPKVAGGINAVVAASKS